MRIQCASAREVQNGVQNASIVAQLKMLRAESRRRQPVNSTGADTLRDRAS